MASAPSDIALEYGGRVRRLSVFSNRSGRSSGSGAALAGAALEDAVANFKCRRASQLGEESASCSPDAKSGDDANSPVGVLPSPPPALERYSLRQFTAHQEHENAKSRAAAAAAAAAADQKSSSSSSLSSSSSSLSRVMDLSRLTTASVVRQGHGRCVYANGAVYDGDWHANRKHGHGTLITRDGEQYVGQWVRGRRHGHGEYIALSGHRYVGAWAHGARHGLGALTHPSGVCERDVWHRGVRTWARAFRHEHDAAAAAIEALVDEPRAAALAGSCTRLPRREVYDMPLRGGVYTGSVRGDNVRHGWGTFVHAHGVAYEGEWARDRRHGRGKCTTAANVYEGGWADGKRHGCGRVTYLSGEVFAATYDAGVLVSIARASPVTHAATAAAASVHESQLTSVMDARHVSPGGDYRGEMTLVDTSRGLMTHASRASP